MKNLNLIFLLFLCLLSIESLGQKKQKDFKIKDTAAFLKELAVKMRAATIEDYKPSKTEVRQSLASNPMPESITEQMLKEINVAYASSFYFRPSPFDKDQLLVESDIFLYPSAEIMTVTPKWSKALDKAGKNFLFIDTTNTNNASVNITVNNSSNEYVKLRGEKAIDITRLEGDITIKAPAQIAKIKLTKDQINKTESLDTLQVRLIKIDNDLASVWLDGDYDNVRIYAFNEKAQQLDINSNTSMSLMEDPKLIQGLRLPKDITTGSFLYVKANGKIDHIVALTIPKYLEQKTKVIATPLPLFEPGKTTIIKERYEKYTPNNLSNLSKPDTTLFSIDQHLKILKEYNEYEKETKWRISYQLPNQYSQTSYTLASFDSLTFYLKGKPIKTSTGEGYFDTRYGTLSFIPLNDEYKTLLYDAVEGTIHVRYPISIKTMTIKKGEKKYGVDKIEGSKLTLIDSALGTTREYLNSSELMVLRAYGKGRWPLKKDSYSSSEFVKDNLYLFQYYWGTINTVQIDLPTEWMDLKLPFKLKKEENKTIKKK